MKCRGRGRGDEKGVSFRASDSESRNRGRPDRGPQPELTVETVPTRARFVWCRCKPGWRQLNYRPVIYLVAPSQCPAEPNEPPPAPRPRPNGRRGDPDHAGDGSLKSGPARSSRPLLMSSENAASPAHDSTTSLAAPASPRAPSISTSPTRKSSFA